MNDFFIASNRSLSLEVDDVSLEVRQIQMSQFDLWVGAADPIKNMLGNVSDYSDEILKKVIQKHLIECVVMLQLITDLDHPAILKAAQDQEVFIQLLKTGLKANQQYFVDKEPKSKRRKKRSETNDQDSTWFDSFQLLVSNGHSHDSIMNMTYGAFKLYTEAVVKREKQNIATQSNIIRMAQHAAAKQFKSFVDELKE
ncbi:hypothetical protein [Acinetobacter tandoii]|uniref:Uncharacterized protein n=1 Tax=Acinetobacter tandoii DSM 14970 = CIP 107469 TaxID=1120927 RepID=R9B1L0_9GAMM|nr:hypothetical protein [Acinetobacter tandoii]EOR08318.1 hypothetical protein I593_01674 [Acinetobacter tandoii DSM 14970 = CIP 107469]